MAYIRTNTLMDIVLVLTTISCGSTRHYRQAPAEPEQVLLVKDMDESEVCKRSSASYWELTEIRERLSDGSLGPNMKDSLAGGMTLPVMKGNCKSTAISLYDCFEEDGKKRYRIAFAAGMYDSDESLRFRPSAPMPFAAFGSLRINAFTKREMHCSANLLLGEKKRKECKVVFRALDSLAAQACWRGFSESMLENDEVPGKAAFDSLFHQGCWSFTQVYDVYPNGLLSEEKAFGKSGKPDIYYQWQDDSLYMMRRDFLDYDIISGNYSYTPPRLSFTSSDKRMALFIDKGPYIVLSARKGEIRLLVPPTDPEASKSHLLVLSQHGKQNVNEWKKHAAKRSKSHL